MSSLIARRKDKQRFRKCFISAPFGCDVGKLVEVIDELGIRVRRLDSLRPGKSITAALKDELKRTDFVCVVLANDYNNSSNLYELGMAIGAGKPTMILAEPEVVVPIDLADWPFGRISLTKPDTIRVAVRPLLHNLERATQEAIRRKSAPQTAGEERLDSSVRLERVPEGQFNKEEAVSELQTIRELTSKDRGRVFEKFVGTLLGRAGIPVALEYEQRDRGVDLAFWLDDVSRVISNPILAEIKTRVDAYSWQEQSAQLIHYLSAMKSQCGVLITLEEGPPDLPRFTPSIPMVVRFSAEELVSLLWNKGLGEEIIRFRNQAVHG